MLTGILVFGGLRLITRSIDITNEPGETVRPLLKSPLTGVECETRDSRPFAVMMSSDREARPLSGIGEADLVFEMPVVDTGFTRMMAVYQCGRPREVGSVRSSRLDFVPLALGVNAIYAHFGGEHEVLAQLNKGIIDNIDGLKYDEIYYFRKKGIPRPHNSFTNFDLMATVAGKLNYDMTDSHVSYSHETDSQSQGKTEPPPLFNDDFKVIWKYHSETNSYLRSRSGQPETDTNTGKPVEAKNVIIMKTIWSPINKDYIRVRTVGSGGLLVYKNGTIVSGTWEKANDKAKLMFFDQNHKEIPLAPGITWVEIDAR